VVIGLAANGLAMEKGAGGVSCGLQVTGQGLTNRPEPLSDWRLVWWGAAMAQAHVKTSPS